jgi:thioredoxin-like negative regulator of GroEL
LAKQYKGKVVFTKVNVDHARDISQKQQIRSMPTFQFYLAGKKKHQLSGADANGVEQWAQRLDLESQKYNVQITKEALTAFYKEVAPEKVSASSWPCSLS